jgi:hypothetical protein
MIEPRAAILAWGGMAASGIGHQTELNETFHGRDTPPHFGGVVDVWSHFKSYCDQ